MVRAGNDALSTIRHGGRTTSDPNSAEPAERQDVGGWRVQFVLWKGDSPALRLHGPDLSIRCLRGRGLYFCGNALARMRAKDCPRIRRAMRARCSLDGPGQNQRKVYGLLRHRTAEQAQTVDTMSFPLTEFRHQGSRWCRCDAACRGCEILAITAFSILIE